MENQAKNEKGKTNKTQPQGFNAEPYVTLSRDKETLIHYLPGQMKIEMPTNFYKSILGIAFTPKAKVNVQPDQRPRPYGFIARPQVYLNGEYLVHRVLGVRISKHINFYKKVLEVDFVSKAQNKARTA